MRYSVTLDKDGYVQNIFKTGNPRLDVYDLDLSKYDLTGLRIMAYKLVKNELVFDENKYNELIKRESSKANEKEITTLKEKLTESDYIVARAFEEVMSLTNPLTWVADVIKIMIKYSSKYKEVISNRKSWRERIEELQGNDNRR